MKIRRGFVSNSSSASYILTLSGSREDINQVIKEATDWLSWDDKMEKDINDLIKRTEDSLRRLEQGSDKFLFDTENLLRERLTRFKKWQTIFKEDYDQDKFTEVALEYCYIKRTDMYNGDTKLEANTVMHNNFTEGMPRILQEIVLQTSFPDEDGKRHKVTTKCEIERDG